MILVTTVKGKVCQDYGGRDIHRNLQTIPGSYSIYKINPIFQVGSHCIRCANLIEVVSNLGVYRG